MNTSAAAPRENHPSARKALRPAPLLVCLAALLVCLATMSGAACGQRGPLYLPAPEPPAGAATAATPSPTPAPDEAVDPEDQNAKDPNTKDENAKGDNAGETDRN
ncbi:MAG: lipoprotein [Lysobacterales bacterium]